MENEVAQLAGVAALGGEGLRTGAILGGDAPEVLPVLFTESGVEVSATGDLLAEVSTLSGALDALLRAVPERGYLAVMAYLDRLADASAADLRSALAARTEHAVTFGWGPRFLQARKSSTSPLSARRPHSGAP